MRRDFAVGTSPDRRIRPEGGVDSPLRFFIEKAACWNAGLFSTSARTSRTNGRITFLFYPQRTQRVTKGVSSIPSPLPTFNLWEGSIRSMLPASHASEEADLRAGLSFCEQSHLQSNRTPFLPWNRPFRPLRWSGFRD